jgi:opacity protein-like surface antigen
MKKILLAAVLLAGVSMSGFAQKKSDNGGKFSIGLEAGIPVGDASTYNSFVIGGSLKYDMPIATATAITLSVGYSSFMGKTVAGIKYGSTGFVPVKVGVKYHFADAFYGEAQIGASFGTQSGSKTGFAYSPGIGYDFGGGLDLGVRYEGWSYSSNGTGTTSATISQIAARLAYSF